MFAFFHTPSKSRERLFAYAQILLGCLIGGASYPLFLTPNHIAPGGLTGVATILYFLFKLPIGTTSLIMNIPLFIIGWKTMGKIFAFRSLLATVLFSFSIDILKLMPMTCDPLLGTLFGGIMLGIGLGLIQRGNATTGGTDMIARMIHHRFSFISVGMILFAIDAIVVIAAGVCLGASEALYALISIYVSGKMVDTTMIGLTANKACYIISDQWEKVSRRILHELERGATLLEAKGAWTKKDRPVVLCVVARHEIPHLKNIVLEEDPAAFMIVTEAHEAMGEGFQNLQEQG